MSTVLQVQRFHSAEVPSTQDLAKSNFRELGPNEWRVYTAGFQTNSRGTNGRPWVSFKNSSVLASYIFSFSNERGQLGYISQIVALATAECLKEADINCSIKWVNDVLVNGRKVAGVLTETESKAANQFYVCVGIGINVNVPFEAFRDQRIDQPATSLQAETGRTFDLDQLIASLSIKLRSNITKLERETFSVFYATISDNLETFGGNLVTFDTEPAEGTPDNQRYIKGVVVGVNSNGALIFKDETEKVHTFINGRILRPTT